MLTDAAFGNSEEIKPVKGYRTSLDERELEESTTQTQPPWEEQVCESVGDVIEFWGFKRNHGRLWALLYLRDTPMPAQQLQQELNLSKGAVSMIISDLERWGVVRPVRQSGKQAWHYVAEDDYMAMIRRVLREREISVMERVGERLVEAEKQARASNHVPTTTLQRLHRMQLFAHTASKTLSFLLQTLQLEEEEEN